MPFIIDIDNIAANPALAVNLVKQDNLDALIERLSGGQSDVKTAAAEEAALAENCRKSAEEDIPFLVRRLTRFNTGELASLTEYLRTVESSLTYGFDTPAADVNISEVMAAVNDAVGTNSQANGMSVYAAIKMLQADMKAAVRTYQLAAAIRGLTEADT